MRLDTSRGDGTAQGTALPRLCSLTWLAPVRSWPGPEVSIPVLWDGGVAAEGGYGGAQHRLAGSFPARSVPGWWRWWDGGPLGSLQAGHWGAVWGRQQGWARSEAEQWSGGPSWGPRLRAAAPRGTWGVPEPHECFWCERCGRGRGVAGTGPRAPAPTGRAEKAQSCDSRLDFGGGGGGDFSPLLPSPVGDGSACEQMGWLRGVGAGPGRGRAVRYLPPAGSIALLQEGLVHRGADPAGQRRGLARALHTAAEARGGRGQRCGGRRAGQCGRHSTGGPGPAPGTLGCLWPPPGARAQC